jgi:UDP-glucuronate 4-epimerase
MTGLRFFTIYGPWGRPDMAMFIFTKAILEEKPIDVFNYGKMQRDFTYIDDIVEGVIRTLDRIPQSGENPQTNAPYKLYNIGNNQPIELLHLIEVLETALGKPAIKNFMPIQPGDVPITYADVDALIQDIDFQPNTSIEVGVQNFVEWYRSYYQV